MQNPVSIPTMSCKAIPPHCIAMPSADFPSVNIFEPTISGSFLLQNDETQNVNWRMVDYRRRRREKSCPRAGSQCPPQRASRDSPSVLLVQSIWAHQNMSGSFLLQNDKFKPPK